MHLFIFLFIYSSAMVFIILLAKTGESVIVIVLFSSFFLIFFSLVIITLYNPLTYSFVCFFAFHLNISRGTILYLYVLGTSPFSLLCS